MGQQIKSNLKTNEVAAVIDEHTGRVRAQFSGFGAENDAKAFLRGCQRPAPGNKKVDILSSATVVTGQKALDAVKKGRI